MNDADGGSAFPYFHQWENERKGYTDTVSHHGMSLRDYFAAQAMFGLVARYGLVSGREADVAKQSYGMADAMLAEREKR